MTLSVGTKLGPYEILASIGSGGMGDVYRARDTKLGREVAIKILPEVFAQDEERLARFEREARLLASVNHPNIATIHDLEESEGRHFLVLELVSGETLAERISRGRVPVDKALPLFTQIAEALEAAHEKGIIHRDLKPANIKITPEGKVKVLDFGLAKAFEEESSKGDLSESPTATYGATRAGVIMGTAPYMSPEQARGKQLDKRTDIWSFGCCLYEALTGRKAFAGDTVTDTIAAVVRAEPDWDALPTDIPWKLRELLTRCLRKDPARRLHEMADVRLDIEDAVNTKEITVMPSRAVDAFHRRSWATAGLGVALAFAMGAIAAWNLNRPEPVAVRHLAIPLPPTDSMVFTLGTSLALSPDGKNVVYAARREDTTRLFLRPMDQLVPEPLPSTEGAHCPFFSPDGRWVGFWADGKLKKVPLDRGLSVPLRDEARFTGASWASDDTIYFSTWGPGSGILRVPASGGRAEAVTVPDSEKKEVGHYFPVVLPNGKTLLFNIWRGGFTMDLAVQSLVTGEQRLLLSGAYNAQYASTGHIVYSRAGTLFAVPFDMEHLEITGSSTPVLEGLHFDTSLAAEFSLSNEGTLAYFAFPGATPLSNLVWVDRQGGMQPLSKKPRHHAPHPRLSPDGRRLALAIRNPTGSSDIWVLELGRNAMTRLTFREYCDMPVWSHDGERIFFSSIGADGLWTIFCKAADGSSEFEQLTIGVYRVAESATADGKALVFRQRSDDSSSWDIGILRLDGARELEILLSTPFDEWMGMISPDGRRLAYVSNESGRNEIYLRSIPRPSGKVQVSTEGGTEPMWSREGRELFYRDGDKLMAVSISTNPDFKPSSPRLLFEGRYQTGFTGAAWSTNYDAAPDGQHFVMIQPEETSVPLQLHVILNWFEKLKRVVPEE